MFTKTVMRKDERGFTLIELLIVIAIIAILAAIAIPQFSGYRERAARASMVADSRNAATVLEAYFTDFGTYGPLETRADVTGPATGDWPSGDFKVKASRGNILKVSSITASSYTIQVQNDGGAGSGKSPLSLDSTGSCTFADSSNC